MPCSFKSLCQAASSGDETAAAHLDTYYHRMSQWRSHHKLSGWQTGNNRVTTWPHARGCDSHADAGVADNGHYLQRLLRQPKLQSRK